MPEPSFQRLVLFAAVATVAVTGASIAWWLGQSKKKKSTAKEANSSDPKLTTGHSNEELIALATASRTRGNKYFNAGRFEDALNCYTESISFYPRGHPDLALALANRAAAHLSLKNFEESLEDCTEALEINPKFVKALDRRSRVLENFDRTEDSLVDAVAAAVIDEFKTESLFVHIEELLKKISETQAKSHYGKRKHTLQSSWMILQFFQSFPKEWREVQLGANDTTDSICPIYQMLLAENFEGAYDQLKQMTLREPEIQDARVYNWLGTMQFLSGDFEAARATFKNAIETNPAMVSARLKLALVAMELGNYMEMTESLDLALKIDETDAAVYYHRGEIFALSNNMESAISDFSRAIQLDAEFISSYVHQARAYLALEMHSAAEEFLKKSLSLFPDHPELLHTMGECLAMNGQYEKAIKIFEEVEKMAPNYPQVLLNKAIILNLQGGSDENLGIQLKDIVEKFPSFDAAHVQLANYLIGKKKTQEALLHYDIAAEHARSYQELVTIHTIRAISNCQAKVAQKYPDLENSIQELLRHNPMQK